MRRRVIQLAPVPLLLSALPGLVAQAPVATPAPVAAPQRVPIVQQLTFVPYHPSGMYKIGETVGWTVTPGPVNPAYAFKYTVRRNNAVVLKEGRLNLASGKDTIEITGDQPEMIYVAIEPYAVLASADATKPIATTTEPEPSNASPSNAAARSVTDTATGTPAASPYVGGNTGRNTGLYALGAAVAPLPNSHGHPTSAGLRRFLDQPTE